MKNTRKFNEAMCVVASNIPILHDQMIKYSIKMGIVSGRSDFIRRAIEMYLRTTLPEIVEMIKVSEDNPNLEEPIKRDAEKRRIPKDNKLPKFLEESIQLAAEKRRIPKDNELGKFLNTLKTNSKDVYLQNTKMLYYK